MKKDEKNGSVERTICTRSLASASTELRRSKRGKPSNEPVSPATSTRKSERLAPSPASVKGKSCRTEKEKTASPLQRLDKGKNVSLENSKGSDKSDSNAVTSSDIEERKDNMINNIEELTSTNKKQEPKMTGRSYRALCRGLLKKEVHVSSNDEELVVLGCSRRVPAGNDDGNARDNNSSPRANSEPKRLQVDKTSLGKDNDFPVNLIRDKEKTVLDTPQLAEIREDSVRGSLSEMSETQKILVSKTSLETGIDLPSKRKRDTAGVVVEACAIARHADDHVMSTDGVIPSPSGCTNNNQPKVCSTCGKRQKVNYDFENLSFCSCIAQPVQESDHAAEQSRPAASRDYGENRQNMQQDKSYDPKLYREYWVPVQLSDVQLEQYCRNLFSKSLSLTKNDRVGALEETLTSVRKTCDHPYVMDASLKQMLTKNLKLQEFVDVEIKASGKLHLLDAMLTQIKTKGLKAVVFYQATKSPEGLHLANILDDFVSERFGQNSYEHGVSIAKKNAINNFNKEGQCFVLLLEIRACSQIKLLRAEAFILFGSSLNPSHDVKLLEKIKIESYSERTKIFRLYSTCTIEEKALILARQNRPLENLNRPLTHALLMWGASNLFDKLDSRAPLEQSIKDGVIQEFSLILSSNVGEENERKLCLILEAKHAQGNYSTDSTLFGEEHVKLSDEDNPNIFWTKLLGRQKPMWKYYSDTPQRSRKRVQYLQDIEQIPEISNGGNIKKQKKATDDVTVDNIERNASGKDHLGVLGSPKVKVLESSHRSTSGTNDTLHRDVGVGLYSMEDRISGIPEDMLAGIDSRQVPRESQRHLHIVLKLQMEKLCQLLHLSEGSTRMGEKFLEYVIENHYVCKEPATTLQAFQIALSWIAALLAGQELNCKESLIHAKSELGFSCYREEVDYMYSMLYCLKSLFLERTQVRQEKSNTKLMHSSEGEKCMTEKGGGQYSPAEKDIETIRDDIKKKYKKLQQNLEKMHEEKKLEVVNKYADKKQKLENEKEVERAIIRIQCIYASTQTLEDGIKRLDHDHERKIDKITSDKEEDLKSLEQMHEAGKKKLAEDEACWISRLEKWAQAVLINCAPIKSGSNKHLSGICSSNTSKNAPGLQICNDANADATYAGTGSKVSKRNQVPEAENTLGSMLGGSTQQVHEMVASRNDKAMDVSTLSGERPANNAATKSMSKENASNIATEVLNPASCQEEFAALNVPSECQIYDRPTSAPPDKDVPLPEISNSSANPAKSASLDFWLNREETLVTVENNRTSHVGSNSDNILDQPNEEACSLDKEIPDELVLPVLHPASVVESGCSTESDQDDQDICHMPSPRGSERPDPATNIEDHSNEAAIEPQPAGSPIRSSPAGQQLDPAANIQGQDIEAAIEPQLAGSEAVETCGFEALEQADQVECQLPSSPAENHPNIATNVEGQNINTSANPHIAGPGAVEMGDSVVSDQEVVGAQDACSLPSSLVGTQADQAENTEGQNITTVTQLDTVGSDAVATSDSPVSDQNAQDASPLPFSSPSNQPDAAVNVDGLNDTPMAEPRINGSDACEMEIAAPGPQVEQSTVANNVSQLVHEGGVEPSAGVTAPVPSLHNSGTGQTAAQPVPQIPFPVFNDPFQHELEKLRRESEQTKKTYEEKKLLLKAEFERKMAEAQAEYQRKFHEAEAVLKARTTEIETRKSLVKMNKLLANAFLSKCLNRNNTSHLSAVPRDRVQQLAQRAAQASALRSYAATGTVPAPSPSPAPASQQPPASSSVSLPSGRPLNLSHCPMPQPRQPLITNIAPSLSASPAPNPAVNARSRAPAPCISPYRSSSSSIPIPATTTTSVPLPQSFTYSTASLQQPQQQQQQQGSNDVVYLSDDE